MNVKKRPRLELATAATAVTDIGNGNGNLIGNLGNLGGLASLTSLTGGGGVGTVTANSLFLTSGMGLGELNNGAQIYLTICGNDDDNSSESQEFYAIESIKQEPDLDLDALHALLPTNLQLPTGCEIYLVKDNNINVNVNATNNIHNNTTQTTTTAAATTTATTIPAGSKATIKLEPDSIATQSNVVYATPTHNIVVTSTAVSKDSTNSNNNANLAHGATRASVPDVPPPAPVQPIHQSVKLDAYKKRDDKRRATHNEVERRRRDKINCWIFKLKEMLPTEGNRYKPTNSISNSISISNCISNSIGNAGEPFPSDSKMNFKSNNGRTPPNDSKSQILIKACDYIKSMQNEIDNLRDCLREAESLRLSNQALRVELENLKQQQELQERFNTAGGSFNVTLNSLNSSATSDLFDSIDTAPNLSTVSSINFTKRGLMITDYDE